MTANNTENEMFDDVEVEDDDSFESTLELSANEIENPTEFRVLPDGEYDYEIIKAFAMRSKPEKGKHPMIRFTFKPLVEFGDVDEGTRVIASTVTYYMNLPYRGCKVTARDFFNDNMAKFRLCFGVSSSEFVETVDSAFREFKELQDEDPNVSEHAIEEFIGLTGKLSVVEEVGINQETGQKYAPKNVVSSFLRQQ